MITNLEDEIELMKRHLTILHRVSHNEPIGIVALANGTGYPQYKVKYSLRVLEEDGFIEPTERGAIITGEVTAFIESLSDRIDELISKLEQLQTRTPVEPHQGVSSGG